MRTCTETLACLGTGPSISLRWPGVTQGHRVRVVANPYGNARRQGCDLNGELQQSIENGQAMLDQFRSITEGELRKSGDANLLMYLLFGANDAECTPMQYGGFYLEQDRELLALAVEGPLPVFLWIVGDAGTYLDFVADLPADAFGWDSNTTGCSVAEMRKLRSGLLCAPDPEADIHLMPNTGGKTIAEFLSKEAVHAN